MTLLVLLVVFVVAPLVELYVIIQVAHVIGGWETIALLLVESLLGAWLMKREGRTVLRRLQAQLDAGRMPGKELVDGSLILFAGALMLTPGFLTDIFGFVLLFPPTRAPVRAVVMRELKRRAGWGFTIFNGAGRTFTRFTSGGRADVFDTTGREQAERDALDQGPRP